MTQLSFKDHRRDVLARRYVYTVVSRRSRGVSLGINLSTENQCNWRCAYCQVPNLSRGGTAPADLNVLRRELTEVLQDIVEGDFMQRAVPAALRRLNDIALSGNGEPFACSNIDDVFQVIDEVRIAQGVPDVPIVVITNGSYLSHPRRAGALKLLGGLDGELWAKLDSGTDADLQRINGVQVASDGPAGDPRIAAHLKGIAAASQLVRTKLQTCLLSLSGSPVTARIDTYLQAVSTLLEIGATFAEVQLYTIARPPQQGEDVSPVDDTVIDQVADQLERLGLVVSRAYAPKP